MAEHAVVLAIRIFNAAFAQRVRAARKRLAKRLGRDVTPRDMAQMLSNAAGCTVSADDYRKYEMSTAHVLMPIDLLCYFAEITGTTLRTLLVPVDYPSFTGYRVTADELRDYENGRAQIPHHLLYPLCVALRMPLEWLLAPLDPRDAAMAARDVSH